MNVNIKISTTSTQLQTMPRNYVTMNNLQKLQLLEEHKGIQETGEQMNLLDLADWAKEKFKLQKLPSKQTILRIIRNESKY